MAASCAGLGASCQFDSDCTGGNLCIQQTCYAACTAAEDCEPPYDICQPYARQNSGGDETVKICVGEDFEVENNDAGNNCEQSGDCCQTDAECAALPDFGPNAVCGADNRCITPVAHPEQGILIRDRTTVDTGEQPADGGLGADIAAVFVRPAATEEATGFGVLLDYSPVNGADGPADAHVGAAPLLDAQGQCVSGGFDETALPLGGEGGYALFGFDNADGDRLRLNNGWEAVVIEWGANCGAEAAADSYDVFFCTAQSEGAAIDPVTDCSKQLNPQPASGFAAISLD
ncbi:hypothetical protein FIV42_22430 [Persicimonas caeni]|uniref:Uncharacterized protein n=1 Tax=Persicimonas caeni TaxID=2292766 RepID=A0A4Y6PZ08_PERCE|nr:hypothetical protein [Persicimonas caeni]QDG53399.1 hypothetical protein FIV42_22430 [Persicimonas caeni]QED34620.1 hypothetical protein FRD00_22425 [Persicimonas caeni]